MKNTTLYLNVIVCFMLITLMGGCALAPDFSNTPNIGFVSFSKTAFNQPESGIISDTLSMIISFEDGDGDIGISGSGMPDLTLIDLRTGVSEPFSTPMLPTQGSGNGISGEITMKILSTCCIFPDEANIPPCESPEEFPENEISYGVLLKDRAGNISDTLFTPSIRLLCN